jgi:HAE1 family hydrophobic/amphiphilic exporter-1
MSLYSDDSFDETFISNYAMINLQDQLKRINGVGQVEVLGAGEYAMRIWVKPDKLDYLNVSIDEIERAINSQSQIVPGGQLGAQPAPKDTEFTYTILMPGQYNTAEEFADIIIRTNSDGSLLRLGDVARVELGAQTYNIYSRYNNSPSVIIPIYLAPGYNAVEVGQKVKATMSQLSEKFPEGLKYDFIVDTTKTILTGIEEIILTLLFALILVILVIYFFIQDFRATLVPIIAIPVSLIGTFMLFPIFGFSINVFSMLALVLAIGLVVDDAIVVVEAVQVNISKGMSPRAATIMAMRTVASPIIATTVVLIAVFLPVGLMPGAAGKLY